MASARIKKKRASIAAKNFSLPAETRKQRLARQRAELLENLRTPEQYQGKLQERGDYYAAIKKYHEYLNKGLIRESSILDKYESADALVTTLSKGEMNSLLAEGAIKEKHIQKNLAKKKAEFEKFAHMIDF